MAYRNKTYVIFDGDNDMWAYGFMLGWKRNEHIEFDFFDAHDLKPFVGTKPEAIVKKILRERLVNTKQAIVVVGESTKNLYRFVRWEIDMCLELKIPIVVANLNKKRELDNNLCPAILKKTPSIHVSFNAKIIQKALDEFCGNFSKYSSGEDYFFEKKAYDGLGL